MKAEALLAHFSYVALKSGLHSLRRGPVLKVVNAGTLNFTILKQIRFSSVEMVNHYTVTVLQFLLNFQICILIHVYIFLIYYHFNFIKNSKHRTIINSALVFVYI